MVSHFTGNKNFLEPTLFRIQYNEQEKPQLVSKPAGTEVDECPRKETGGKKAYGRFEGQQPGWVSRKGEFMKRK